MRVPLTHTLLPFMWSLDPFFASRLEHPSPKSELVQCLGKACGVRAPYFKLAGLHLQVMALWLLAYVIIGQVALPIALSLLGIDRDAMSIRGHALLHLSLDMSQVRETNEGPHLVSSPVCL